MFFSKILLCGLPARDNGFHHHSQHKDALFRVPSYAFHFINLSQCVQLGNGTQLIFAWRLTSPAAAEKSIVLITGYASKYA